MAGELTVKDKSSVNSHTVVEIVSAAIILFTIVGLAVGIMFPGRIMGALFPLALAMWYILYLSTHNHT